MTTLKTILLAGTLVPALASAPFAGAFAQGSQAERHAPDADEAHHGKHAEGRKGVKARDEAKPGMAKDEPTPAAKGKAATADAPPGVRSPEAAKSLETKGGTKPKDRAEAVDTSRATGADDKGTAKGAASAPADTTTSSAPMSRKEKIEAAKKARMDRNAAGSRGTGKPDTAATPDTTTAPASNKDADAMRAKGGEKRRATDAAGPDTKPVAGVPAAAPGRDDDRKGAGMPAAGAPGAGASRTGAAAPGGGLRNQGGNTTVNVNNGDRGGNTAGSAAAIGAAAGFAGGFLAATGAQRLEDIRRDRREVVEDGRTYIREPGRTIVEDPSGRSFIVHDENDRFRELGYDVRRERRGADFVDIIDRPGGEQILTFTTPDGRLLRRVRRTRDGREFVLIDNGIDGHIRPYSEDVVVLPPPPLRIPRERYVVDYSAANEGAIYDTLVAPPVAPPPRRYTLDQIRYSPDVRSYVRSVDINTINFDSGSWTVPAEATGKLQALGAAIKRAASKNPDAVFLVEGYTDATGNANDNLSLSDRRAQSVAAILSKDFGVPPENLTTQGYGQQNLKEDTQGPSAANRRVVVRNITQLLADGNTPPKP